MNMEKKEKSSFIPTGESKFYYVEDVRRIMEFNSTSPAYRLIQRLNKELKEKGYITKNGAIPKEYFDRKFPKNIE